MSYISIDKITFHTNYKQNKKYTLLINRKSTGFVKLIINDNKI